MAKITKIKKVAKQVLKDTKASPKREKQALKALTKKKVTFI